MAEYGKLDNPTRDIEDFKKGDFARFLMYDERPSVALVVGVEKAVLKMAYFEDGFPRPLSKTPKYGGVRKATEDEALEHFSLISNKLEEGIEKGDLSGAISARKHHHLNGVLERLTSEGVNPYDAVMTAVEAPGTGLYVLMGIYSGHGPSKHFEGLAVTPRLSEGDVSETMIKISPNGFGNIPNDVYNIPATSHGSLVAMRSYEVPESARGLVLSPKRLESVGSEWVFSEAFAKE